MNIESATQAYQILDDVTQEEHAREAAVKFLAGQASPPAIQRLVRAMQDDDFGVRWEAAAVLARLGSAALPELLKALTDPHRVSDLRLRESAYHMLHYNSDPNVQRQAAPLMKVLKGPAADINTMVEANRLLAQIETK